MGDFYSQPPVNSMARQLPPIALLLVALAATSSCLAAASENRRLLKLKAATSEAQTTSTSRALWIDPKSKPTSTKGFDVIISITCNGQPTAVNSVRLRTALQALNFDTSSSNMSFGGNAATTGWRSITVFVVNVPTATSTDDAKKKVSSKVTVKALNTLAKLPSNNQVVKVDLTAFKAY